MQDYINLNEIKQILLKHIIIAMCTVFGPYKFTTNRNTKGGNIYCKRS